MNRKNNYEVSVYNKYRKIKDDLIFFDTKEEAIAYARQCLDTRSHLWIAVEDLYDYQEEFSN